MNTNAPPSNTKIQQVLSRLRSLWRKHTFVMAVFLILSATLLTFFLQYRYFLGDFGQAWDFFTGRPLVFWYNAFLMLLILLFLTGFTRRPAISVGTMLSLIIILTFIHINKFNARGYPLLPEDLALASEAASLSKFINVGALALTILATIAALAGGIFLDIKISKHFLLKEKKEAAWWRRFAIIPRLTLIVVSSILFLTATDFVRNNAGQKYQDVPWLDSQLVAWNQVRNYDNNGFILGFLYNLQRFQLVAPDGYSEKTIQTIRKKYEEIAKEANLARASLDEENINFVVVLNESFFDPARISDFYPHTGGEIIPNLRKIEKTYPSGHMFSLDYGGGTANIEFEALTGLSNYWANTVPFTTLLPKLSHVPSIATFLKSTYKYPSTAMHPFNGSMYKRDIAYKALDIERFITEREMRHAETEGAGGYISDHSAYSETLDVLAEKPDSGQFIALATMQNHLPFGQEVYGEGADMPFQIEGDHEEDQWRLDEIAVYFKLLSSSDHALGAFIASLDESPQKTVVLFYGDHSPGVFSLVNDHEDPAVSRLASETPYFIYANFDSGLTKATLPTTTPNCLINTTFNLFNFQKPPLFYLLDQVCDEVPILTDRYLGEDGFPPSPAMRAYELINYDILGGSQYWLR